MGVRSTIRRRVERHAPWLSDRLDAVWIEAASRLRSGRPGVTAVVAHRDDVEALERTLNALTRQSLPTEWTVVVDDGSSEASARRASALSERKGVVWSPREARHGPAARVGAAIQETPSEGAPWLLVAECGARPDRHRAWRLLREAEQRGAALVLSYGSGGLIALCHGPTLLSAGGLAPDLALCDAFTEAASRLEVGGHRVHRMRGRCGAAASQGPEGAAPRAGVDVLFMPHNAYHTREMAMVAEVLRARGRSVLFVDITSVYPDEGSGRVMRELGHRTGLPHTHYTRDMLEREPPGVLFVMNDWSPVVHDRVIECRSLPTRTVALVEGVQDFEDSHVEHFGFGVRRSAYRHADAVLLVGEHDRRFFPDGGASVTGSTRIEALTREPRRQPGVAAGPPRVVINSNFTYGLYTEFQRAWLESALHACELAGAAKTISRHHADGFDFSGMPVSQRSLYEELREARVLVSRFSGVMLEAMALGVAVVYHNPHGERIDKFLDPQGAFPVTSSPAELATAIQRLLDEPADSVIERQRPFFEHHVSIDPARTAPERIADAIDRELQR